MPLSGGPDTVAAGGALPNKHSALLPKKNTGRSDNSQEQLEEKLDHVPASWDQPSNSDQPGSSPSDQYQYWQQMAKLKAMGFANDAVLRFLLQEKKGNVDQVVGEYHLYSG